MTSMGVRVLFAAAVVALPAQVLLRAAVDEPYPGLYQPAFGGVPQEGAVAFTTEHEITVSYEGARSERLTVRDILPPASVSRVDIFRAGFYHEERAEDVRTRRWLRKQILKATGGNPQRVLIRWLKVQYGLVDRSREVVELLKTIEIDVAISA